MDDLSLDTRKGLPDALRILLEEHPREAWESDPGFHGLVEFWLDRHLMFRRLTEVLKTETTTLLDGGEIARFGNALPRYGGMLLQQLHGHHQIEDHHYFPMLSAKAPEIARGFELMDADHHLLDARLNAFAEAANAGLGAISEGKDAKTAIAPFETALIGLEGLLDRHLTDEEELVVPVVLKYGGE